MNTLEANKLQVYYHTSDIRHFTDTIVQTTSNENKFHNLEFFNINSFDNVKDTRSYAKGSVISVFDNLQKRFVFNLIVRDRVRTRKLFKPDSRLKHIKVSHSGQKCGKNCHEAA